MCTTLIVRPTYKMLFSEGQYTQFVVFAHNIHTRTNETFSKLVTYRNIWILIPMPFPEKMIFSHAFQVVHHHPIKMIVT